MYDLVNLFPLTDRPIASIAFHAEGELLAVASGHKVLNITLISLNLHKLFSSHYLKGMCCIEYIV